MQGGARQQLRLFMSFHRQVASVQYLNELEVDNQRMLSAEDAGGVRGVAVGVEDAEVPQVHPQRLRQLVLSRLHAPTASQLSQQW